jgi:hypothetical protein
MSALKPMLCHRAAASATRLRVRRPCACRAPDRPSRDALWERRSGVEALLVSVRTRRVP